MCDAIRLPLLDFSDSLVRCYRLNDYVSDQLGGPVVTFRMNRQPGFIPYWHEGELQLGTWTDNVKVSEIQNTLIRIGQSTFTPEPVNIPAYQAHQGGVWSFVAPKKIRGILTHRNAAPSVSVLVKPASDYYERKTHCAWEPVYVGDDDDPASDPDLFG